MGELGRTRTLLNLELGCSAGLTIIGLGLTLTFVGAELGIPVVVADAIGLIPFAVARAIL